MSGSSWRGHEHPYWEATLEAQILGHMCHVMLALVSDSHGVNNNCFQLDRFHVSLQLFQNSLVGFVVESCKLATGDAHTGVKGLVVTALAPHMDRSLVERLNPLQTNLATKPSQKGKKSVWLPILLIRPASPTWIRGRIHTKNESPHRWEIWEF